MFVIIILRFIFYVNFVCSHSVNSTHMNFCSNATVIIIRFQTPLYSYFFIFSFRVCTADSNVFYHSSKTNESWPWMFFLGNVSFRLNTFNKWWYYYVSSVVLVPLHVDYLSIKETSTSTILVIQYFYNSVIVAVYLLNMP